MRIAIPKMTYTVSGR